MKALIILFDGEYLSSAHKKDMIGTFMSMLSQCTNATGEAKLIEFNDEDVAKCLLQESIKDPMRGCVCQANPTFEDKLIDYCQLVLKLIGPVNLEDEIQVKTAFVKTFITDERLRKNKEVVEWLLKSRKPDPNGMNILKNYHLVKLPLYVKEINSLIHINLD